MNHIQIADTTLCGENHFTFKEKLEIARLLDRLNVDTLELPEIKNEKTDELLIRTIASFVKNAVISVAAGSTRESIASAAAALKSAASGRIRIEIPISTVCMEYTFHMKAAKMLQWIREAVTYAVSFGYPVEFAAMDATRADRAFLCEALNAAQELGASYLSLYDQAETMMPDDFADFVTELACGLQLPLGIGCRNQHSLSLAAAMMSLRRGISYVKASVIGEGIPMKSLAASIRDLGVNYGFDAKLQYTELNRILTQITRFCEAPVENSPALNIAAEEDPTLTLSQSDDRESVEKAAEKLGYDLSEEDKIRVFEKVQQVLAKKTVGIKELDAIIASVAMQVPSTYTLENYVINNGNIITASAQVTLSKNGQMLHGISIGDGPVDAAFRAAEQTIGCHYELDDFQIQSVTEGKEAIGQALVKLRNNGRVYSGSGISTDILGASLLAYINAVNKIVYEEM